MNEMKITSDGTPRGTSVVLEGVDVSRHVRGLTWSCGVGFDELASVTLEVGGVLAVSELSSAEITILGLEEVPTEILRLELESRDEG